MQKLLWIIVAIVFGANFGALTALWFGGMMSGGPTIGNAIDIDGWRSDWSIGSENANPYVRARVARNGLMGLRKEEAVYFLKTEDDQGDRLQLQCRQSIGAVPEWLPPAPEHESISVQRLLSGLLRRREHPEVVLPERSAGRGRYPELL